MIRAKHILRWTILPYFSPLPPIRKSFKSLYVELIPMEETNETWSTPSLLNCLT